METDRRPRPAMGMSLGLAVARRALLLALVALLMAIVALVAAFVVDSGSDTAETVDSEQAQADAAAASADAEVASAMAEASAASTAAAQEAAAVAQDAAAVAQATAATAQEAAARAESVAAAAAAALETLAAARAESAPADASESDAEAEPQPAESQDGASEAEAEAAAPGASAGDTDTTGEESEAGSTGAADGAPEDGPAPATADPAVSLPGEPFELGPPAGAGLAVVGVSHASVLNVRDVPAGEIVARLDNVMNVGSEPVVYVREAGSDALIATLDLNRGVIATGNNRKLPTTIWYEIRMGDAVGWASSAFLSPLGATSDSTAEIIALLGEMPSSATLDELGRIVGEAVASDEPPSRVVVSGAPTVGDLGEITIDVLDLPDDSVRGYRLHVFAQQDPDSGSFVLKTVESTTICDSHRGVGDGGLCN